MESPVNAVEARTSKKYWCRIALLWGMFGFFGLVIAGMARNPVMGIFGLLMLVAPAGLLIRRRTTWLLRMDGSGVSLPSGKHLSWAGFERVLDVHAVRGGADWHSHYELVFRDGKARVFDGSLENATEVVAVLKALEGGEKPFA